MNERRRSATSLVGVVAPLALTVACGVGGEGAVDRDSAANGSGHSASGVGEYVVERGTEGGIETVRTVSGSRWGGDGMLVEELVIGAETGEEPYLFGSVASAWATDDRIYAVDTQAPAVRAYDHQGRFLLAVGRVGQGPGEYSRPMALAVTEDGRILVTDLGARLNVFGADGKGIEASRSIGPTAPRPSSRKTGIRCRSIVRKPSFGPSWLQLRYAGWRRTSCWTAPTSRPPSQPSTASTPTAPVVFGW